MIPAPQTIYKMPPALVQHETELLKALESAKPTVGQNVRRVGVICLTGLGAAVAFCLQGLSTIGGLRGKWIGAELPDYAMAKEAWNSRPISQTSAEKVAKAYNACKLDCKSIEEFNSTSDLFTVQQALENDARYKLFKVSFSELEAKELTEVLSSTMPRLLQAASAIRNMPEHTSRIDQAGRQALPAKKEATPEKPTEKKIPINTLSSVRIQLLLNANMLSPEKIASITPQQLSGLDFSKIKSDQLPHLLYGNPPSVSNLRSRFGELSPDQVNAMRRSPLLPQMMQASVENQGDSAQVLLLDRQIRELDFSGLNATEKANLVKGLFPPQFASQKDGLNRNNEYIFRLLSPKQVQDIQEELPPSLK